MSEQYLGSTAIVVISLRLCCRKRLYTIQGRALSKIHAHCLASQNTKEIKISSLTHTHIFSDRFFFEFPNVIIPALIKFLQFLSGFSVSSAVSTIFENSVGIYVSHGGSYQDLGPNFSTTFGRSEGNG